MFELRPALNAREQGRYEKSVAMALQPTRDPGDVPVDNPAASRIYGSECLGPNQPVPCTPYVTKVGNLAAGGEVQATRIWGSGSV
jgi:hypothetical protein